MSDADKKKEDELDAMPDLQVVGKTEDEEEVQVTLGKLEGYMKAGVFSLLGSINFKARTSLRVAKLLRKVQEEIRDYGKQLEKLGEQYGEKGEGEEGQDIWNIISPVDGGDQEKWDSYKEESKDLRKHPVDLSDFSFKVVDFKTGGKESDMPAAVIQMMMDLDIFEE